jgi:hypothetical protein
MIDIEMLDFFNFLPSFWRLDKIAIYWGEEVTASATAASSEDEDEEEEEEEEDDDE